MWYLDESAHVYRRAPKQEGPRAPGAWREPEPGDPLYDLEPHPYEECAILPEWPRQLPEQTPFYERCVARGIRYAPSDFPMLFLLLADGQLVSAPGARQVFP